MVEAVSLAARRARSITVTAPLLAGLIVVSVGLRSVIAWRHSVPRLFPDEYIYASLGRSIGYGHLQVRGQTTHFPAILEPILAAPIWRFFDIGAAYHLVQVENALLASLAAVPAYLLARWLNLSKAYAFGTALYTLVVPELVLIAYTSSDAAAFPFAVGAIYVGVLALETGSRHRQIAFFLLASLATLARVEYVALVAAYLLAAIAIDRREAWRRHRFAFATAVPAAAVFLVAMLGYYANERNTPINLAYVKWFFLQLFLLAVATGAVMVPGAVAALTRPQTRRERSFAIFAAALTTLFLAEATAHAAKSSQFKERYLFVLTVLVPLAFGLYIKNGKPRRWLVVGVAIALILAAARLPLSEYATASFKQDSQFLFAVSCVQREIGTANASLVIALLTTVAAAAAIALAFRGGALIPFVYLVSFAVIASAIATREDLVETMHVRQDLAPNLSWVDALAREPVDAIETRTALKQDLLYELYWNESIKRELRLGQAIATDSFGAAKVQIARDGTLMNASNEVLFHDFGTTGWTSNATVVGREGDFVLWKARGRIRLRLLIEGRFRDGWLGRTGRLNAWTHTGGGVLVRFRLLLPQDRRQAVTVHLGRSHIRVTPGQTVGVTCSSTTAALNVPFLVTPSFLDSNLRRLSVKLDQISVEDQKRSTNALRPACAASR